MEKLNFEITEMNGQEVWLCEPYKIVHYDYLSKGNFIEKKSNYSAYKRNCEWKDKMLFGNHVCRDINNQHYDTLKQAIRVCQQDAMIG